MFRYTLTSAGPVLVLKDHHPAGFTCFSIQHLIQWLNRLFRFCRNLLTGKTSRIADLQDQDWTPLAAFKSWDKINFYSSVLWFYRFLFEWVVLKNLIWNLDWVIEPRRIYPEVLNPFLGVPHVLWGLLQGLSFRFSLRLLSSQKLLKTFTDRIWRWIQVVSGEVLLGPPAWMKLRLWAGWA